MSRAILLGAAAAASHGALPAVPILSYTASNQFTITNYDSSLTYTLTNCTRSGNKITPTSGTATITAKYSHALLASAARTAYTAAHGIVLDSIQSSPSSVGCGPRSDICCPGGTVMSTAGNQCGGSPGTLGPDGWCGGSCPGNCFTLYPTCWYYHWTDYSGSGYTLIGSVWGKAV